MYSNKHSKRVYTQRQLLVLVLFREYLNEDYRDVVELVDLMDSTKLSRILPSDQFKRYIQIFSSEMTYLIDGYNGYVLKYAGDGVIGFFLPRRISWESLIMQLIVH